jgi:hypothetical protein
VTVAVPLLENATLPVAPDALNALKPESVAQVVGVGEVPTAIEVGVTKDVFPLPGVGTVTVFAPLPPLIVPEMPEYVVVFESKLALPAPAAEGDRSRAPEPVKVSEEVAPLPVRLRPTTLPSVENAAGTDEVIVVVEVPMQDVPMPMPSMVMPAPVVVINIVVDPALSAVTWSVGFAAEPLQL